MDLSKYQSQIEGIAVHAKLIGFNPETGNYDDLYRSWIQMSKRFWEQVEDNREDVQRLVKTLAEKG
jgi:hypothetical protein